MRKLWLMMLLFLPTTAWGDCTGASPLWNSTPDYTSLSVCVSQAISGDTINVSAGTATWPSRITWTGKNLTLIGAGSGVGGTSITNGMNIGLSENPVANSSRVSGFAFTAGAGINIAGRGFRIDHNTFTSSTFSVAIYVTSASAKTSNHKGLIDNNTFTTCRVLILSYPGVNQTELNGTSHWSLPLGLGTDDAVYVEDNTFNCPSPCINVIDANDAGQYVFRFNRVNDGYIEAHGVASYRRGTRKWEVYGNTIVQSAKTVPFITFLRSGTGVLFNNTATGAFSSGYSVDHRRTSQDNPPYLGFCDGDSPWDGNTLSTGWLCRDQIGVGLDVAAWVSGPDPPAQTAVPAYAWSNTRNGANGPIIVTAGAIHILPNRDYYDYTASFTGASGVGVGTRAQRDAIATCATGVAFWVTDEGHWNSKQSAADGVLYRCTAPSTWTLYYVPYFYPHPMRSGLSAPSGVTVAP